MDNKQLILKTFNKQFSEFIEDISNLFPGEKDIIVVGTFMKTIMFGKARAIIDVWYKFITVKYNNEIENGEIEYFLNKDYSEDLEAAPGSTDVLDGINKLRSTIKKAFDQESNKEKTIKYMQNLTKLSNLYYNN
jgi:hypothetical protein